MKNKRAVSLMLSYVLLVIIGIALSIGVYSWLKFVVKGTEGIEKCPEGISLVIQDYNLLDNKKIELNVKNKGLFNISGYYIKGTDDKNQEAWFNLKDVMAGSISSAVDGTYLFLEPLPPNAENSHVFLYEGLDKLEKIELEPFRIQEKEPLKKKKIVLCEQGVISQEISLECRIDGDCDSYREIYCDSLIGDVYKRNYSCINNKCIPGYSELITPCTGLCIFKSCINGLVSFWRFDETDGIAYDSANGNDGKIYGNTRLLMHFDEGSGDPKDNSSYENNGVNYGAIWTSSGQSGNALQFDGVNDYVNVSSQGSLSQSGNPFTVSMWIKRNNNNTWHGFFGQGNSSARKIWYGGKSGRTNVSYFLELNEYVGGLTLSNEQWHHVALSYQNPGELKGYIDGRLDLDRTSTITIKADRTYIGVGADNAPVNFFNGSIDEVAIYSKALSLQEIIEINNSGRGKFIERVDGQSGNALSFDGIDDYVNVSNLDEQDVKTNNITISAWVNTNYIGNYQTIYTQAGSGTTFPGYGGIFLRLNQSNSVNFVMDDSSSSTNLYSANPLNQNTWYHLAVTDNGTTTKLYVNGSLEDTDNHRNTNPDNNILIGRNWLGGSFLGFTGTIDEVMVFNQALSQENITSIYQYYTG